MNQRPVRIYSTVNAGLLIEGESGSILIDSIFSSGVELFSSPDEAMKQAMLGSQEPFNRLSALLFTHVHKDHCDLKLLAAFQDKTTPIILPYTEARIRETSVYKNPVVLLGQNGEDAQEIGFPGHPELRLRAFRTVHDGGEKYAIAHFSFLLTIDGVNIFVMGDADPSDSQLHSVLKDEDIDAACLNYVEIHRETGRRLIQEIIKPAKLLLYHIPLQRDDRWKQQQNVRRDMEKYGAALPPTTAAFASMDFITAGNGEVTGA